MSILLVNSNAERIPLADGVVHAVVTSPPYYGLRKYAVDEDDPEIGLEDTPELYLERMVAVFREVRRVLRDDGVCFVNMGDTYSNNRGTGASPFMGAKQKTNIGSHLGGKIVPQGYKEGDLMNIPARLVLALQADGWYHRSTIIWSKPNPMPESVSGWRWERHRVKVGNRGREQARMSGHFQNHSGNNVESDAIWRDCPGCEKCEPHGGLMLRRGSWRPTTAHEYIFMLTKTAGYWADGEAVREEAEYGYRETRSTDIATHGGSPMWNRTGDKNRSPMGLHTVTGANPSAGRNARTVWDFPTAPYSGAAETSHLRRVSLDEVSDGMICIPSPNCPDHAGLLARVASEFYGERKDALWSRIENTCNHLALKPFADYAPIDQQRALGYEVQSSGYFPRSYSPTAIDHNNETHRMALALDSSPAYIPFFEIVSRIADKSRLLVSFVQHLCIYGNSILRDETDAHLLDRIPHRIVDKSSHYTSGTCLCQYYEYYTRVSDHFATYPPELPRRCLKASISERGCCPKCGSQWARVVDVQRKAHESMRVRQGPEARPGPIQTTPGIAHTPENFGVTTTTLGWLPTCECGCDDSAPPIVLDPFAGSGTTGLVARELGAHFIGLDLSFAYLHEQARGRLGLTALDAWSKGMPIEGTDAEEYQHKNMTVPGRQPHSFHVARVKDKNGKVTTDLPLFQEVE